VCLLSLISFGESCRNNQRVPQFGVPMAWNIVRIPREPGFEVLSRGPWGTPRTGRRLHRFTSSDPSSIVWSNVCSTQHTWFNTLSSSKPPIASFVAGLRANEVVQSICLFGSEARGESTPQSDIDLLLLVDDFRRTRPSLLLSLAPPSLRERVSIFRFSASAFSERATEGSILISHLKRESVILYDRGDVLTNLLLDAPDNYERDIAGLHQSLRLYDDLSRFNANFTLCLSHLYVLGRRAAMIALASANRFTFDSERLFPRLAELSPPHRSDADRIRQLKQFYFAVHRDASDAEVPDADVAVALESRDAVRRITELAGGRAA
jgi:predicted nucleotidyltransferase